MLARPPPELRRSHLHTIYTAWPSRFEAHRSRTDLSRASTFSCREKRRRIKGEEEDDKCVSSVSELRISRRLGGINPAPLERRRFFVSVFVFESRRADRSQS